MSESNTSTAKDIPGRLTDRTSTQLKHPPALEGETCWKCGKPAIARCPEDQFPTWCGKPECDEHPHEFERHGPTFTAKQSAPERIRLLIRDGLFDDRWYFTDAAVSKYDTQIEYARVSGEVGTGEAWRDKGGHAWEHRSRVDCVECPHCCFVFAAVHTDGNSTGYSCPNCSGCPEAAVAGSTEEAELEVCPVCKNKVSPNFMWSYNHVPNAFCQDCVDSGRV